VNYRGRTRPSGRALRAYVDRQAIERVTVDGGLLTAPRAAEWLEIHRSDVDPLIRQTRSCRYIEGLAVLLEHPAFDGKRSAPHRVAATQTSVIWPPNKERRPEVES
jgi:hypothetical protein